MWQVFKEAGLKSPVLGSIVMGCINLGSTLLAAALMDRAGRRLLLILSHAGMGTCLLLIAIVSFIPGKSSGVKASFSIFTTASTPLASLSGMQEVESV